MAGDDDLRICIDRVVPPDTGSDLELALPVDKMWKPGTELKCRFLDGSAIQKRKVEAKAHLWEEFANITVKFVTSDDEHIRISFVADDGSWSAVGTDALVERYYPKHQPTMNFGWLRDSTRDIEYRRIVLHEFGHALGCIHEHQSPKSKLKWKKAEVMRVFAGPPNFWSPDDIVENVLKKYSVENMNASEYDPASIMLYSFPGTLFTDGVGTSWNEVLSAGDKAYITQMYPRS